MTTYTKEQQKEHRRLWVEALRSGKYQQGRKTLRTFDGAMCCLGVACEISKLGRWIDDECYEADHEYSRTGLPPAVREWLGLPARHHYSEATFDNAGSYAPGAQGLSGINDAGKTFAEIADIIESEPPGLIA